MRRVDQGNEDSQTAKFSPTLQEAANEVLQLRYFIFLYISYYHVRSGRFRFPPNECWLLSTNMFGIESNVGMRRMFCASLRSGNAPGHVTRSISCACATRFVRACAIEMHMAMEVSQALSGNIREKCRSPGVRSTFCARLRSRNAHGHVTRRPGSCMAVMQSNVIGASVPSMPIGPTTTLSCPKPKRPRRCSCWRGWRHKPGQGNTATMGKMKSETSSKKSGLEVSHGPSMARTISYSAKWSCVLCKLGGHSKIVGNMYNQFCKLSIVKCVKWLQWARWSSTVKKTWQTNHKAPKRAYSKRNHLWVMFFRGVPWIKRFTDCYRY